MIVRMKKVSLVVHLKDKEKALDALGNAKVFHTGRMEGHSQLLDELTDEYNKVSNCVSTLPPKVKFKATSSYSALPLVHKMNAINATLKEEEQNLLEMKKELARIDYWPEVLNEDVAFLMSKGLYIRFYEVQKNDFKNFNKVEAAVFVIGKGKGTLLVAVVDNRTEDFPKIPSYVLPKLSVAELQKAITASVEKQKQLTTEWAELATEAGCFAPRLLQLENDIAFEKTLTAIGEDEELALMEGFIPTSELETFKTLAKKECWGAIYSDPTPEEEEKVPTLTKQKGVGKLISPILGMLELTPGYNEFDISGVMFFFFSLFFAMIIGDGGYGAIFLILGGVFIAKKVAGGGKISAGNLSWMWLSFATIVWGAMTGNWFGLTYFKELPVLSQFIVHALDTTAGQQKFVFTVGLLHLSVAHLWAALRHLKTSPLVAFADLGSLSMVAGLYFLVIMIILGNEHLPGGSLPNFVVPMIIGGLLTNILFSGHQKGLSFVKGTLAGLGNAFPAVLGSLSNFSDIISYIRLFAIGLAGLSIAEAFNGLALSMGNPVVTFAIMAGAACLNMTLAMLSVIVHGIRLNSLEFSSHLGLKWAGTPYQPFAATKKNI